MNNTYFSELNENEMLQIEGGALKTASDWMLMAGGIAACFVSAPLGVAICVATCIWS